MQASARAVESGRKMLELVPLEELVSEEHERNQQILVSDSEKSDGPRDPREAQMEELRRLPTPPESKFRFVTNVYRSDTMSCLRPPLLTPSDAPSRTRPPAQRDTARIQVLQQLYESEDYGVGGNVARPSLLLKSSEPSEIEAADSSPCDSADIVPSDVFECDLAPNSKRTMFNGLPHARPRIQRSRTIHIQPPRRCLGAIRRVNTTSLPYRPSSSVVPRAGGVAKPLRRLSTRPQFRMPHSPTPVLHGSQSARLPALDNRVIGQGDLESESPDKIDFEPEPEWKSGCIVDDLVPAQQRAMFDSSRRSSSELVGGAASPADGKPLTYENPRLTPTSMASISSGDFVNPATIDLELRRRSKLVDSLPQSSHEVQYRINSTAERIAEAERQAKQDSTSSIHAQSKKYDVAMSQIGVELSAPRSTFEGSFELQEQDFDIVDRLAQQMPISTDNGGHQTRAPASVARTTKRRLRGPPPPSDPTALVSLPSTFASGSKRGRIPSIKRATTVWGGHRVDSLGIVELHTLVSER
ncbi:hypothetical protein OIV83_002691 [Microbotryomycetes sp. JL201]|nr:hypothetical protein OIV83_002691 [Microbotryomycetes sp. JL201]